MNLTLDHSDSCQLRRSLQSHIEAEFSHLERYTDGFRNDLSEPLASCLQEYYEQVHDEHALEDPVLTLLLARSLWHLGEEDLALDYLDHARGVSISKHHQALLSCRVPITPAIAHLVSVRVLRSCRFISTHHENQWILDLSRLDDEYHSVFELTRQLLLRKLLDGIGPVFDLQDGAGVLWVRRFIRRPSQRARWGVIAGWPGDELREWTACMLQRIARNRGWKQVPEVCLMEFSP
jgi:hypothetical protein